MGCEGSRVQISALRPISVVDVLESELALKIRREPIASIQALTPQQRFGGFLEHCSSWWSSARPAVPWTPRWTRRSCENHPGWPIRAPLARCCLRFCGEENALCSDRCRGRVGARKRAGEHGCRCCSVADDPRNVDVRESSGRPAFKRSFVEAILTIPSRVSSD